jgi:hypothetical protein
MVSGSCWPAYTLSSVEVLSPVCPHRRVIGRRHGLCRDLGADRHQAPPLDHTRTVVVPPRRPRMSAFEEGLKVTGPALRALLRRSRRRPRAMGPGPIRVIRVGVRLGGLHATVAHTVIMPRLTGVNPPHRIQPGRAGLDRGARAARSPGSNYGPDIRHGGVNRDGSGHTAASPKSSSPGRIRSTSTPE